MDDMRRQIVLLEQAQQDHVRLYWTDEGNNMPPSCGNYVAIKDLRTDNSRGWYRNPTSKIWYCPACDAVHKS